MLIFLLYSQKVVVSRPNPEYVKETEFILFSIPHIQCINEIIKFFKRTNKCTLVL